MVDVVVHPSGNGNEARISLSPLVGKLSAHPMLSHQHDFILSQVVGFLVGRIPYLLLVVFSVPIESPDVLSEPSVWDQSDAALHLSLGDVPAVKRIEFLDSASPKRCECQVSLEGRLLYSESDFCGCLGLDVALRI